MRCRTSLAIPPTIATMLHGSMLLSCLLLIATSSDAARSPRQRAEQRNPYAILPPGLGDDVTQGKPPIALGEKEFVCPFIESSDRQQLTPCTDAETYLPPWISRLPRPPPIYGHPRGCSAKGYERFRRNIRVASQDTTSQGFVKDNTTACRPKAVDH